MNLLLTGCFKYTEEQIQMLCALGYTTHFMQKESEELPFPATKIDAVVCNSLFLSHNIDEFSQLKFIQLTSAGLDRVPVELIRQKGIQLYNARGVYSIPMAEWTLFRVLEQYKQGWFFRQEQVAKRWVKHRGLREIYGIKIAIIGAGNVGQEVAKRFQAFGAEITGFDVHTDETIGFHHMFLIKYLKNSVGKFDVMVVTAPLLPSTKGLISGEILASMKKGAILVNISRGGLIDEQAMCEILEKRKDLFAVLDVFENEPLAEDSPLWKLENVAISPHNSFVGNGNSDRMFKVIHDNLRNFIDNR